MYENGQDVSGEIDVISRGLVSKRSLSIFFEQKSELNQKRTADSGYPVADEFDYFSIHFPGSKDTIEGKVTKDMLDYWEQNCPQYVHAYNRWKETKENKVSGTPVKEWPIATLGEVKTLEYVGFKTVEDLATASDAAINALGPSGLALRAKAAAWIKARDGGSVISAQAAEIERMKTEMEATRQEMEEMLAVMKANQSEPKKSKKNAVIEEEGL